MFQKISFTLSFGSKKQWLLFALFLGITFLQCCLFHWLAFNSILVSSLWKNPLAFWAFYLPKISISLFIASFVFLFKRQVWTIIFSALLNIWIMAELMYFRANRIFLDAHSFSLISNMDPVETEPAKEGGCGASVAAVAVALVAALGTCTAFISKKR